MRHRVLQLAPGLDRAGRQAAEVARRFHLTLVLSGVIGVVTGVLVAGFEVSVAAAIDHVTEQPWVLIALTPAVGLLVVNLLERWWRGGDTATTDAYVRAYHQREGRLGLHAFWRKAIASAVTLGSGNAFGFEGPAMLIGGTVGSSVEARFATRLRRDDAKVLMVAGAAAGVAAVFKAPLTGVVFALEVPYRADVARRALLPSLVAAGAAYVTYVALVGTDPLLPAGGAAPFDLRDLGGGLLLGLLCGLLARLGAQAMASAKRARWGRWTRVAIAAAGLVALAPIARSWFDGPYHLGPSYAAIEWATDPDRTVAVLCGLFALRAVATWLGVFGNGMGGLFIPLVTQGAIVGALFGQLVDSPNPRLFPTIGIAALLGAGYRTPLAGVAFVAEATGEPGFLVPALLAAAAAQLMMGRRSFSAYQRNERLADLQPLAHLPVAEIVPPRPETVDAGADVDDVLATMLRHDVTWIAVVDAGRYVGVIAAQDLADGLAASDRTRTARDAARTEVAPAVPTEPVAELAQRLRAAGCGATAIVDGDQVVGIVTLHDIESVEVLLDRLQNEAD